MRLHDMIGKQYVLILVDSGANASFINTDLAAKLERPTVEFTPTHFVAANGASLVSSQVLPQLQWLCQGHSFVQDFQVLLIPCYDMILGADWLENHSPMWVHWKQRWMRFTHNNKQVKLTEIQDQAQDIRPISATRLHGLLRREAIVECLQVQPVH